MILSCLFALSYAQDNKSQINLQSSYLIEVPGGDLADRFGLNSKFEFRLEYLKNSWAIYAKSGLRIGENVKEDVLAPLRTSEGFVTGVNGFYADLFGRKRGFDYGIGIDKILKVAKNSNHSFRFGIAAIKAHHWIRIADESKSVPQILGDYSQLYDHFVSGLGIEENIQFQYNSKNNNAAFIVGLQFQQIFSKEHRQQLIQSKTSSKRNDLYFGLKLSYLLPLFNFDQAETIYY